jgi:hypothetical protein
LVALIALISPRAGVVVWWLLDPGRWGAAFNAMWLWPVLGFLFLPWTTLAYVLVAPTGTVNGLLGWLLILIALLSDLSAYGGGYRSRRVVVVRPNS